MDFEITEDDKRVMVGKELKKMWAEGHFSICSVDRCLKIMGLRQPRCYEQWRSLHCVDWNDMPEGMPERLMASVIQELTKIGMNELIDAALSKKAEGQAQLVLDTMKGNT